MAGGGGKVGKSAEGKREKMKGGVERDEASGVEWSWSEDSKKRGRDCKKKE